MIELGSDLLPHGSYNFSMASGLSKTRIGGRLHLVSKLIAITVVDNPGFHAGSSNPTPERERDAQRIRLLRNSAIRQR
jgi:hypothetical protein